MKRWLQKRKEKKQATTQQSQINNNNRMFSAVTFANPTPIQQEKPVARPKPKSTQPFIPTGPNHFDRVPAEITLSIFKRLPLKDLASVSQTSKSMRHIAKTPSLGLSRVQQSFLNKDFYAAFDNYLVGKASADQIQDFIKLGADVNSYDFLYLLINEYTRIHYGQEKEKSKLFHMIMFFLENGADIDKQKSLLFLSYRHLAHVVDVNTPLKLAEQHRAWCAEVYDLLCVYRDREIEENTCKYANRM